MAEDHKTGPSKNYLALDEPVVVLTCARSGSTLLRVILDAHPELACPPETNIVKMCGQLGRTWELMDPASSDGALSETAATSIKAMVNTVFTAHLLQNGKRRWCDKSLGTVRGLGPFIDLYPKTKFICLYRHCMDVIGSGLEASPFGLRGYGFENYITRFDGNSVAAIAALWCEDTGLGLDFEEAHPDQCHRVYYEHIVENPEKVAADLFSFIGVEPDPGITERCFNVAHSFHGPGDYKVIATNHIAADSVGRGARIPVDFIPPALLHITNNLLERLGYAVINDNWKQNIEPPELLPSRDSAAPARVANRRSLALLDRLGEIIDKRLGERLTMPLPSAAQSAVGPTKRIGLAAYCPGLDQPTRCWQLDLSSGTSTSAYYAPSTGGPHVDWLMTGDVHTWLRILSGEENIAASARLRTLRYINFANTDGHEAIGNERKSSSYLKIIKHLLDIDGAVAG
jgi:protein-tyrosine sulfotransferase